jgi:hypothetical protein
MVINATFNNISVTMYIVRSVSLVEETGENPQLLKVALNTITHKPLTITLDYWGNDTLGD